MSRAAARYGRSPVRWSVFILFAVVACGGDVESGETCFEDAECGEVLTCYCAMGDAMPGVCSIPCDEDADCAGEGEGYTCRVDFCAGANVCLRTE